MKNPMDLKAPPQNTLSEQAILGAIFLKPDLLPMIQTDLSPTDLYRTANADIYTTMIKIHKAGDTVEPGTVLTELKRSDKLETTGGEAYISKIIQECATTADWKYHVRQINDTATRRKLIDLNYQTTEKLFGHVPTEEILSEIKSGISSIDTSKESEATVSLRESLPDVIKDMERGVSFGVPSGFDEIDKVTSGWQGGDLIIIAGRPAMGKSVFAKDCAENAKAPTLYFSLEMSKEQLIKRQLSGVSGLSLDRIRGGDLGPEEWGPVIRAADRLSKMPIYYNDSGKTSIGKICSISETYKMRKNIGLVVIDYLQLIRSDKRGSSREQEVSAISRELKGLARDLDIPVICLAQLNRKVDDRKPPLPILSDLRESGAIEQDADFVGFLYRPWMYDKSANTHEAHFYLAKGRNTRTGKINLVFNGPTQTFKNAAMREEF